MKFKGLLLSIAILYISICACTAFASTHDSSLIKGFAQYQAGRVENIALDNFINDLANEKYLKQFFPETSASINGYSEISGKRLIPLLEFYFDKDLESLKKFAKCVKERTNVLNKKNVADKNRLKQSFEALDWLLVFKQNEKFTIEQYLTINECEAEKIKEEELKKLKINLGFTQVFLKVYKDAYEEIKEFKEDGGVQESIIKAIDKNLESLVKKKADDGKWATVTFGKLGVSDNDFLPKGIDFPGFMKVIQRIAELNDSPSQQIGGASDPKKTKPKQYTIYVHQLVVALEALGFQVDDREGFRKFKSSSLFLASLAEAANLANGAASKAVAGVIGDFVNEDEVYKNKRSTVALYTRRVDKSNLRCSWLVTCKNTWFVGSYYGLSVGRLKTDSDNRRQLEYRAFGPVGIEFKLFSGSLWFDNKLNSTVTFMAAPFDIGVYITNELNGADYDVNFDDIAAPSYFFSFSSKESPMSLQVGFQKDIPITNIEKDSMWFLAFSYDLPLFTIW